MKLVHISVFALVSFFLLAAPAGAETPAAQTQPTAYKERLVYFMYNLDRQENIDKLLGQVDRAAKAGYTHIVITDCKFFRWNEYAGKGYVEKVQKVRKHIKDAGLKFIAICGDQGSDLLSNDPSLAEGTPVVDAPFMVKDGRLVPVDSDFAIKNIELKPGQQPGTVEAWQLSSGCQYDQQQSSETSGAIRFEIPEAQKEGAAAKQVFKVKPYRYYYLSAMVKTEDFADPRSFDLTIVGTTRQSLSHRMYGVKPTQDWTLIETTFNTMDNEQVALTLSGSGKGKLWVRDMKVQPGGLVDMVRREACPVKVTSADGKTIYEEGKDLAKVIDPKANWNKWPGDHEMWYDQPVVEVMKDGRLKEGDKLLLSYYISQMTYSWGVFACPNEPKTLELVKWQIQQIHKYLQPDGYMLAHDEIRHWGQDPSCQKSGRNVSETMAYNVRKCYEFVHEEDPDKPVYIWSDMFDPTHNARKLDKPYYLCKGNDPFRGSWEGLDKNINVILWWGGNPNRAESTKFFVDRGHKVILSTSIDLMPSWMEEAYRTGNGIGTMFTVWDGNYSKMEAFGKMLDDWKPGTVEPKVLKQTSDLE